MPRQLDDRGARRALRQRRRGAGRQLHGQRPDGDERHDGNRQQPHDPNGVSDAGGGLFADFDTTVTVRNSTVTSNTADEAGGGIYAQDSALVTVSGGAITHNESGAAGGGIALFGAELTATNANISSNLAVMGGESLLSSRTRPCDGRA